MILKTKDFKEAASKILLAADLDKNVACLELLAKESRLYLNVTNKEFYVSVKFPLTEPADFRAVVNAGLFLKLIAALNDETFELNVQDTSLQLKTKTTSYKLPRIYINETLLNLPTIELTNKTVEMPIKLEILQSILNINSKELLKIKNIDVDELQRLYYIDENGCFTFTTGACLNAFKLDKPVKMLLNDRIVKLFKLFKTDVYFEMAHDQNEAGEIETKVRFKSEDTCITARIVCDNRLIDRRQGPCNRVKGYISENYGYSLALPVDQLTGAITRLSLFTKQSDVSANNAYLPINAKINGARLILTDRYGNTETVEAKNLVTAGRPDYDFSFNRTDLKLILDSVKSDVITLNCGNHKSIFISRGTVYNVIPEIVRG